MSDVTFVDTTLRDGNQSLWAYNMRTAAMLEAIEGMDRAGLRVHGVLQRHHDQEVRARAQGEPVALDP